MPAAPRALSLVAVVLLVAVIAVDARVVFGGRTWADVRYHTEVAPPRLAASVAVRAMTLPAWWDGTGLGVPLAAEPSHGAWYPPQWLPSTPRGFDLFVVLHLAWAALGVAVWSRGRPREDEADLAAAGMRARRGVLASSEEAALVAGLLAATTGLLASTAMRGALPGLAHLPWLGAAAVWLVDRTAAPFDATSKRDRAYAAVAIAGLLGLVGLSGQGGALLDGIVIVVAIAARKKTIGALALAVLAGLAIACVQWIPAAMLLLHGEVAGARVAALPMARLVELIIPGSFGARDLAVGVEAIAGRAPWAPSIFTGAAVLALAAVRTPARRVQLALAVLVILVAITGRGHGGWPAWLGAPESHLAALVLVLAAHAGVGIDALIAGERRALRAFGVGTACTAIALLALVALRSKHPASATAIQRAILDGSLGLACLVTGLMIAARRVPGLRGPALGRGTPLLLALLVLPSVGALPATAPLADRELVDEPAAWTRAILAHGGSPLDHVGDGPPVRVFRPAFMYDAPDLEATPAEDRDARLGLAEALASLAGNAAARHGVVLARSEDPARPAAQDRTWLAAFAGGGVLLDRLGIGLVILSPSQVRDMKLVALGTRGKWTLAEYPTTPLASVMHGNLWAGTAQDALALTYPPGGHAGLMRGTVVLQGRGASVTDADQPEACTVDRWRAGDVAVGCTTARPGYAVLSAGASPGWSATVDGSAVPWFTADVLRRAVALPAGTHEVRWTYSTPGQTEGLLAALAGLAIIAALLAAAHRTRSASQTDYN